MLSAYPQCTQCEYIYVGFRGGSTCLCLPSRIESLVAPLSVFVFPLSSLLLRSVVMVKSVPLGICGYLKKNTARSVIRRRTKYASSRSWRLFGKGGLASRLHAVGHGAVSQLRTASGTPDDRSSPGLHIPDAEHLGRRLAPACRWILHASSLSRAVFGWRSGQALSASVRLTEARICLT